MRRSLSFAVVVALPTVAAAQIRVVDWNTLDGPSSASDANFRTVFGAISSSAVHGIAKRPDVVALQEQSSTSTANLAALLNSLYGVSSYVAEQPAGQTATDRLGYVYDSARSGFKTLTP